MKPNNFSFYVSKFLSEYLPGIAGFSSNTIFAYRDMFKGLLCFYEDILSIRPERITIRDFNSENIACYLSWLTKTRGNSTSTRNNRLAAIHAFAKYVARREPEYLHNMQEIISIQMKQCRVSVPIFLSVDAMEYLLSLPDTSCRSGRRDCVLLSLLYDSGARVQELCDLVVKDIRLESPPTIRLTGKGAKTRIVPLMPPMAELLHCYIEEHGLTSLELSQHPLFINHCGKKFGRKGISYVLSKYFEAAKSIRPELYPYTISPHSLRHSKSMHLLQAGVNLIYIRDILGHADVKTTEIYARIDSEMKRKALEKATVGVVSGTLPIWQADSDLREWLNSLR